MRLTPRVKIRDIPFPAEVLDDPDKRSVWYRDWSQTDDGKSWQEEYQASEAKRRKLASYTATVATDGTFAINDVVAGEYTLSASFWDGSRIERLDGQKISISTKAANDSEKIALDGLELK